ncbi:MAG: ribonuclease HII [Candidatus Limivicinus sp.]|nr:ribonuclease HII [Clostridiales bacterium]MDY3860426.1 ribonuclease HII [Candidatus Limivicinus sp.]
MTELWTLENEIYAEGYKLICGVDEAGRGPLAGPVYAAAVILPRDADIPGLNDSKKLTEKKREALFDVITRSALSYGIASASVEEIEKLNILNATFLAMNRAVAQLDPQPELTLVDGNRNTGIETMSRCIVKGDSKCADIAAASVLAKVSRDRYMLALAEEFPEYHFEKHKGYGTKLHYEALREFGPLPVHRVSFLRKMH